jgi:hypothetical protein
LPASRRSTPGTGSSASHQTAGETDLAVDDCSQIAIDLFLGRRARSRSRRRGRRTGSRSGSNSEAYQDVVPAPRVDYEIVVAGAARPRVQPTLFTRRRAPMRPAGWAIQAGFVGVEGSAR